MKRLLLALAVALAFLVAPAVSAEQKKSVHVKGYTKKDGTYVPPHDRKAPPAATSSTTAERDEKGRIQRSDAAKHAFARSTGYPNGRPGYVIDHIKPLACGGKDDPSNMQWQTIAEGKAKDSTERKGC